MARPISEGVREIELEDGLLHIELRRSSRRTLGISVSRGEGVVVTAPWRASEGEISEALGRHRAWIRRKEDTLRKAPPLPHPPNWQDGDTLHFLGREYPLRLIRGRPQGACFLRGQILVRLPRPEVGEKVQTLVEGWMLEEARAFLPRRMVALIRSIPALGVAEVPPLSLRRMKRRWGSCSASGRILLNTHLIQLPLELVDYVLIHELCHLKHPNHSKHFWAHLTRCMPDWKAHKGVLDSHALHASHLIRLA